MTLRLIGRVGLAAVSTVAVMAAAACGSDQNTDGPPDGPAPAGSCAGKDALTAEGATSQKNAVDLFGRAWATLCPGKIVSYHQSGSAAGREQFIAGQVDFAGSDSPLSTAQIDPAAERCHGNPAWHLPLVFGPIALAYHLDGVANLVLTPDLLARIFSGGLTRWNDPAIADVNPGVALADTPITPIFRLDSSGTTDNFQQYLAAAAPRAWTEGAGSEFQGGAGEGAQKSAGVVQAVQAIAGAIGYVEQGFAGAGMTFAQIDSGSGPVPLSDQTAQRAVEAVAFVAEDGNDLRLNLDSLYTTTAADVYPLVLATYEIVCSKGYDAKTAEAVKSFLTVAANGGQEQLPAAGYIRLPDRFQRRLTTAVDAIR